MKSMFDPFLFQSIWTILRVSTFNIVNILLPVDIWTVGQSHWNVWHVLQVLPIYFAFWQFSMKLCKSCWFWHEIFFENPFWNCRAHFNPILQRWPFGGPLWKLYVTTLTSIQYHCSYKNLEISSNGKNC